jgi:hypothetical protein
MPGQRCARAGSFRVGQICQPECLHRHDRLKDDHNFALIPVLDEHTGRQGKQQRGECAREADQSQVEGAAGHAIGQIGQGCGLHPRADDRDQLSKDEQNEIA